MSDKDITLEDLGYERKDVYHEVKGKLISYIKATCYPDRINTESINFKQITFYLHGFEIKEWVTDAYIQMIRDVNDIFISDDLLSAILNKLNEIGGKDEN